ncbi:MAG: glycosyltransferase family 1 protein [Patescibacteria group bacterium]
MRIGIDARFYGPQGKGLGRYTQKLILNLEKRDHQNQYFVFLRNENWDDYQPQSSNFHRVKADYRWYSLREQLFLPWVIRQQKLDLMHFPHFNVPVLYFGKMIVTIHDLIITNFPTKKATTLGPIKYWLKQRGYKTVIRLAVKRAQRIITVSQYSKQQIIKHFKIDSDKIVVTYEACDSKKKSDNPDPVLAKYKISRPYLLYVGNVYPHKNIERLLKAFAQISKERFDLKLVLVGKEDYFYKRIKGVVDDLDLLTKVIFTGFVIDADLAAIYQESSAYIFPSIEEGFGLPPLEAMSYGVPVVSSNSSCLPEVLGQAAHYFDPLSIEQIISSVNKVLDDSNLRDRLVQSGLGRIQGFSWSKLAEETLKIYQSVL